MQIPPTPPPGAPATPPGPDALQREALRIAVENGKHARMTMWSFRGFAAVLLLSGLQFRHGWPVQISDFAYAGYAAYLTALWLWIYRRRR